jgi:hypothetical protein
MNTTLTTKAFRAILPAKNARVASCLASDGQMSPLDALKAFYASETYHLLETEETKSWWESPEQLYHDYLREQTEKKAHRNTVLKRGEVLKF